FFLKNPGIYEKMDGLGVNLRGFPTISICLKIEKSKSFKRSRILTVQVVMVTDFLALVFGDTQ
ncbi:MAG: hypothetical protein MIO93_06230, partial [ANME-2 cluster archaeon]|nr:hypothetical protein [ANME-2 cluster archaeon]